MEPKELIEPLSEVIRKYPRSGGPDPKGLQILRGGKIWGEGSADPEEVAKLLLGTQFDGKKATASCFKAASLVTAHYGWSLSWKEDFSLGAFCYPTSSPTHIRFPSPQPYDLRMNRIVILLASVVSGTKGG